MSIRVSKTRVQMARQNILMRVFHCNHEKLPFLEDHISREHRLIFFDMIDEHLIEQGRQGYHITQLGIAHWRRIVKHQRKSTMNSDIFRHLLEDYDHTGAPVEAQS